MVAGQPLRGFVAQSLSARKPVAVRLAQVIDSSTTGSITVAADGYAQIFGWGAGGAGPTSGGAAIGAGGGAAGLKQWPVRKGEVISWAIGVGGPSANTDGGDTTIDHPSFHLVAGGGKASGAGGACQGPWDIPRNGGAGGNATTGESPLGGGQGGAAFGSLGGGGGAAGFNDLIPGMPTGGNGSGANLGSPNNTAPGGALGATGSFAGSGKDGRVLIYIIAANA